MQLTDGAVLRASLEGVIERSRGTGEASSLGAETIVVTDRGVVIVNGVVVDTLTTDALERVYPAYFRERGMRVELDCNETPRGIYACLPLTDQPTLRDWPTSELIADLARRGLIDGSSVDRMVVEYRKSD
jgi:hypothetical protein